jgi:hypothetical protein
MPMLGVLALLAATVALNVIGGKAGLTGDVQMSWTLTMGLFALMFIVAGFAIRQRWDGVFIDRDNRISLSRFQLIAWTVVLVSALFSAGLWNAMPPSPSQTPLKIDIPPEIWALLGLGAFSAVAAPTIKDGKRLSTTDPQTAAKEMAQPFELAPGVSGAFDGAVFVKESPRDARWVDLIHGDYEGAAYVDVSKLQQLAFTALLIVIYAASIWAELGSAAGKSPTPILRLPEVDGGFIALLGISHAAYLADKQLART